MGGGRSDSHVDSYVLVVSNPLTGEAFDNVPVHKRKLGELQVYFDPTSYLIDMLVI